MTEFSFGVPPAEPQHTGQNVYMPARRDAPSMPPAAAAAHHAISGTSRLTTLKFLLGEPGSTRLEISEATGISLASARVALSELEDRGYVRADVEGPRNGRVVRFTANREKITDDLMSFVAWAVR